MYFRALYSPCDVVSERVEAAGQHCCSWAALFAEVQKDGEGIPSRRQSRLGPLEASRRRTPGPERCQVPILSARVFFVHAVHGDHTEQAGVTEDSSSSFIINVNVFWPNATR